MASSPRKELHSQYCGGRVCPKCYKCRDWYYDHRYCADEHRGVCETHVGPLIGPLYSWHRRDGATCGYHAYPHYVYYAAYHGNCPYAQDRCSPLPPNLHHSHGYRKPAIHGPYLCHCVVQE